MRRTNTWSIMFSEKNNSLIIIINKNWVWLDFNPAYYPRVGLELQKLAKTRKGRMSLLPSYPAKRGHYTVMELRLIAVVLGYDGDLFRRCLSRRGINLHAKEKYTEFEVKTWLDDHVFDLELDRIFNHYTANDNVRVIKKVMFHLQHKSLTYNEVGMSRRVFQAVTAKERRITLSTDKRQILYALKMANKVLPPTKLHHLLQAMGHQRVDSTQSQSIRLYDFFDIVSRAEDLEQLTSEYLQIKNNDPKVQLEVPFETPYHQLLTWLDGQYRASLVKKKSNTPKISKQDKVITSNPQKMVTSLGSKAIQRSIETRDSIRPVIEQTTLLVHLARAGNLSLSSAQGERTLSRLTTTSHSKRPICTH